MGDNEKAIGVAKGVNLSPFKDVTEALFGVKTMDESLRLLGDMLFSNLVDKRNIEVCASCFHFESFAFFLSIQIEGKIGKIVDRHSQVPFSDTMSSLQIRSETVLAHRHPNAEFVSSLSRETFQQLNNDLNKRYETLIEVLYYLTFLTFQRHKRTKITKVRPSITSVLSRLIVFIRIVTHRNGFVFQLTPKQKRYVN